MPSNPNLPTKWLSFAQAHPLIHPTVPEEFFRVSAWRRSIHAILYCILSLEHWIAPAGWIREWVRLNILVVILIGTAVLLIGPVIQAALDSLLEWADAALQILIMVMSMISVLPPLFLMIISGVCLMKIWRTRRDGQRSNRNSHNQQFYE